jgi:hypothetical protein
MTIVNQAGEAPMDQGSSLIELFVSDGITPGWKGFPGTRALAYLASLSVTIVDQARKASMDQGSNLLLPLRQ